MTIFDFSTEVHWSSGTNYHAMVLHVSKIEYHLERTENMKWPKGEQKGEKL